MTPTQVVLMVLAIVGSVGLLNALVWIPIIRKLRRMPQQLRDELAGSGERLIRGPESSVYRGSSSSAYPQVKGNGIVALTESRVILRKAIGKGADVPIDRIKDVRQDKWFLSSYSGGAMHVILQLDDGGEVGFFVRDASGWADAVRNAARTARPAAS